MSPDSAPAAQLVVVVPVRDRPDLVQRAVESVVVQGTREVAVVVVDDGSLVPLDAASFGDARVAVVRTRGVGVSAARNAGVLAAESARWITFLDSDDEAKPGWTDAMLNAHHAGYDLFSCGAEYRWAHGDVGLALPKPLWTGEEAPCAVFLAGTFSLRRELFLAAGSYREGLRHSENSDLGWRVADELRRAGARASWTDEQLLVVNAVRKHVAPSVLFESAALILQTPAKTLVANKVELANLHSVAGVAASRLGRRRTAVRMMWGAVRCRPTRAGAWARLIRATLWRWPPSA